MQTLPALLVPSSHQSVEASDSKPLTPVGTGGILGGTRNVCPWGVGGYTLCLIHENGAPEILQFFHLGV
jgi:hypothetical protein